MPHQCTTCGYVFADGSKEMLSGCPECGGATFQFHPDGSEIPETSPSESPPDSGGGRVGRRVGRATSTVREWISTGSSTDDSTDPTEDDVSDDSSSDKPTTSDITDEPDTSDRSTATETVHTTNTANTADSTDTANSTNSTDVADTADDTVATDDPTETETPRTDSPQVSGSDEVLDESNRDEADVLKNETSESESEDAAQASARSEFVSLDELPSSSEIPPPQNDSAVDEPADTRPDLAELREELNDQFESIKIIEPGQYELNLMELYDREEYIIALQENGRYVIQMPETWLSDDTE